MHCNFMEIFRQVTKYNGFFYPNYLLAENERHWSTYEHSIWVGLINLQQSIVPNEFAAIDQAPYLGYIYLGTFK